jgi:glycosyltransferase involved in cell wall biosynthesis
LSLEIAYLSPLPPQRTGIADYSADLLPYLRRSANITAFADDDRCLETTLPGVSIRPMREYADRVREFDLAIYQMGNSQFHEKIYQQLKRYPGITVLHDYGLHHLIASMTAWRGDFAGYARELGYAFGAAGVQQSHEIRRGLHSYALFEQPVNERVLDSSLGVIVHSHFAARQIQRQRPDLRVRVVSQPIVFTEPTATARQQLGLPADAFIVGCAGQATVEKRIDLALRAFARLQAQLPSARFLLVGEVPDWYPLDLDDLVQQLNLQEAVIRIGYASDLDQFRSFIAAMDACINLRCPTLGETSASLLRTMALGKPVIVSNVGWYAELPDEACIKFDHASDDEVMLARKLIELAGDRSGREAIGHAARSYVARECAPEKIAQAYVDLAETIVGR